MLGLAQVLQLAGGTLQLNFLDPFAEIITALSFITFDFVSFANPCRASAASTR